MAASWIKHDKTLSNKVFLLTVCVSFSQLYMEDNTTTNILLQRLTVGYLVLACIVNS